MVQSSWSSAEENQVLLDWTPGMPLTSTFIAAIQSSFQVHFFPPSLSFLCLSFLPFGISIFQDVGKEKKVLTLKRVLSYIFHLQGWPLLFQQSPFYVVKCIFSTWGNSRVRLFLSTSWCISLYHEWPKATSDGEMHQRVLRKSLTRELPHGEKAFSNKAISNLVAFQI